MPFLAGLATFCTALCLGNLFDGLRWWLLPSAGAILLAGVVGEASRRLHAPWLAVPVLYLIAGWCYVILAATDGPGVTPDIRSEISLAPSASTWRGLHALAESGSRDIHSLAVPVPERAGFLFLTVAGVYVIAALVDGIACGLRRPAAAGLPMLALLAVPAAVLERGVGLLAFLAACAAYLTLLLVSGRRGLTDWARLPPGSAPGIGRATGTLARRIGVVALLAALALPVVIPRYTEIARHHRGGGGGSGSATVIEPVVTLAQQLHSQKTQALLTVRTNTPEYLRLTALEHFNGQTFSLGSLSANSNAKVSRGLPAVAAGRGEKVDASIRVLPVLHQRYLPVPYQPTAVDVSGDWRLASRNFTIFSAQTTTSGLQYTVTSQVATPTAAELRSQSASSDLPPDVAPSIELPGDLPTDVAALSSQLTGSLNTEYDKAAAIQAYLRGPLFTYDLNGAPTGDNALSDFLFRDRRGYCEQFAGAMVVLAREAGIPARVAVGFTPGTQQADGSWVITNHDAHSWPELWFPQAGWVRFEPTPRDASTAPPAYTIAPPPAPDATPSASVSAAPSSAAASASVAPQSRRSERPASGVTSTTGAGSSSTGEVIGWSAGGVALVALLLAPALLRRRRRRLRLGGSAPDGTDQHWREVLDTAADLGFDLPQTLSPRRAVAHWARPGSDDPAEVGHQMPSAVRTVLLEAALAQEVALYSGGTARSLDSGPTSSRGSATRLRSALQDWERSRGLATRLRAGLVPRSLWASLKLRQP